MTRTRFLGSAAVLAALLFLAVAAWKQDTPPVPAARVEAVMASNAAPMAAARERDATVRPVARLRTPDTVAALRARLQRSSLRGAEVDGSITLAGDGSLRLDAGLVRRFDHYLSLIGEFDIDEIRALLQADLQRDLPPALAATVLAAFEHYLGWRAAVAAAPLSDDLVRRNEQLRSLRRDWFGADAEAMFGPEESHTSYSLARRALQQDANLGAAEREVRLAALDAARTPAERDVERDATAVLLAEEQTRQFESSDTDAATRAAERSALWGEEAAQRLAQLDAERAHWDRRIAEYVQQRDRLLRAGAGDPVARQRALAELRQRSFTPDEQRRIESLESVGALPPGG